MAPGLWVKVQVAKLKEEQRPKDLCSALPGQQSQKQEALPCPGKQRAVHTGRGTVQACTYAHTHARALACTPKCTLTSGVERALIKVQELLLVIVIT